MKKVVIYASTTGNTEAMAKAIVKGAKESGAAVYESTAENADVSELSDADVVYLGSPAMGDEVLEDSMEDFYSSNESALNGKKVAIFGSYDWGDGQWLRDWADRLSNAGATVINGEGLKCCLTPDDAGLSECEALGSKI